MYLIQFRLQFFLLIFTFYTRNSDYQIHAIASMVPRKSRPSPPLEKKLGGYIGGLFCYFFFIWGPFCFVFLLFGGLFTMWGPFATFYFMVGAFFWACPPSLRKFLRAPMIARRVREHAPWKFFCVTAI